MRFLERLAEEKIEQAIARGELTNLKGAGKPIAEEAGIEWIAPELRMAYRMLKNAGFVPEEVRLRREIEDVRQLLAACTLDKEADVLVHTTRLKALIQRLGELRGGNLLLQERYLARVAGTLAQK